jgi:hypothetical protein
LLSSKPEGKEVVGYTESIGSPSEGLSVLLSYIDLDKPEALLDVVLNMNTGSAKYESL